METSLNLSPIFFPMAAAIVICSLVLMYAVRHRQTRGSTAFIILMSSVTLWQLAYFFWLTSMDPQIKVLFDKISYIGIALVSPSWLWFAFQYSGEKEWLTPSRIAMTLIVPVASVFLVWTNEYHWLIWSTYDFYMTGDIMLQNVYYGPFFWVFTGYSYLLLLAGSLIIIKTVLQSSTFYRRQAFFLLAGVLFPWVGNFVYIFKIVNIPGLDFTPFLMGVSGVLVGIGLYFFHLLSIVPIARKALIEGSEIGLLILDGNNRVVDINPACRSILNIHQEKVIGEILTNVWSGDQKTLSQYIGVNKLHTEIQTEQSGKTSYYDFRIQPLYKDNGIFLGRLVTLQDVSELRRAQIEQNRIQKLETVEVLAGGIAHDFNNHLSIIDGNMHLLEIAVKEGRDISKYAKKIYNASQKAGTVTKQLLSFTRGIEPHKVDFDVSKFLLDLAELLLSTSNANYETDFAEEVINVNADMDLLSQVFSNLIINADQAMPDGGTVRLSASNSDDDDEELPDILKPGRYVKISVADEGLGISDKQLLKIFDPYYTTKEKGSGLGLAVSFAIVQKHNGFIHVDSELGKGTVFTVYLPAAEE